jgi:O-acetylserine/cysteine efflux transporter
LRPIDVIQAVLVTAVWGFNFIFVHIALEGFPPLLLCAVRFLLAAVPVFWLPRPKGSWVSLIVYGNVMFALQFSLIFSGMTVGMPAGLASLLVQIQIFFTMGLAVWLLKERPSPAKVLGALVSFTGLGVVAFHVGGEVSLMGGLLTLLASLAWSLGNILTKKVGASQPLALVSWGSLMAFPTLAVSSLVLEGPERIAGALSHPGLGPLGALSYIVCVSTFVGYTLWGALLVRFPTATVTPFTLLVPVFGFLGSVVVLGESFPAWKAGASALVVAGLCVGIFGDRESLRRSSS